MIYAIYALALLLAVAVIWFLARPLTRGTHTESRENFHQLQLVRDRLLAQLNELDLEERDKNMAAETAADERVRMESELAEVLKKIEAFSVDMKPVSAEHARSKQTWRAVVVVLAIAIPVVAAGFYFLNANVPITQVEHVAAMTSGFGAGGMPDPMQMVARLEQRLRDNPEDLAGWLRLGRSYVVLRRLDDAIVAYDRAYPLLPRDFTADGPDALWFLGLAAYNRGDGPRAVQFWETLLKSMPPDDASTQQLKHAIAEAKKRRPGQKSQQ